VSIITYVEGILSSEISGSHDYGYEDDMTVIIVVLGDLLVRVLAIGTKVCGLRPDRWRWIFKVDKNPQHTFLRE
jgi:hypothetical protein